MTAMADKGRILVVDDDRLVLATVSHGLSQAGYEVIDADNGDDAILLARQHRPGLALLDLRMEGKSGFDVAAYLREHLHTPFMFLSAFSDEGTLAQVRALGALAYLVKPVEMAQLLPAVEQAFAHRGEASPAAVPAPSPDALVPMALGVLMHRYSIPRGEALSRLRALSLSAGLSLDQQAQRIVEAVELLAAAAPAPPPVSAA
jgi:response regulator NasT